MSSSMSGDTPESTRHELKFAVLQTDTVVPEYQPRHGDYPDMFVQLLGDAGIAAGQIDSYDVQHDPYPEPTAYAGYLITGSKYSVYDQETWIAELAEFVGVAMAAGRKVVGICFGHQLLAHFFGGHVGVASNGWAVGVHQNTVHRQLPWMQPRADNLSMLSSHQDQVLTPPTGAELIVSTEHCPVAGFVVGDFALGLQSHPEYSAAYAADLMRLRTSTLGPSVLAQGLGTLEVPLDTKIAGQWIANFLLSNPLEEVEPGTGPEVMDAD